MTTGKVQTRRDRYREETKADLSRSAFNLAVKNGLSNVRIPQIAAAAGVSTRTFNNYFSSKEEAIVWPVAARADQLTTELQEQSEASLKDSLIAAITSHYSVTDGRDLLALIATEPSLQAEYLKASHAVEQALAEALSTRLTNTSELEVRVLAAVVIGTENVAVQQWATQQQPSQELVDVVRDALGYALVGLEGRS